MIRLIEILEVFLMTALMIGGTSQVIIPAFWGKPLFPMFRSKNRSQKRLDDAKQRLEAAKAAKEAAEHEVEVAKLRSEAAEFTKQEQIKLGEGEGARKRAVMAADGALEKKLAAWEEVNKAYAAELGKQRWVPEIQMGGSTSGSNAINMVDLLQTKLARDLMLDLNVRNAAQPAPGGK